MIASFRPLRAMCSSLAPASAARMQIRQLATARPVLKTGWVDQSPKTRYPEPEMDFKKMYETKKRAAPKKKQRVGYNDSMTSMVLSVGRVTKVTTQNKRFRYRTLVAVGDQKGVASFGIGKAVNMRDALETAYKNAMKDRFPMDVSDPEGALYHNVIGEFNNTKVKLYRSRPGTGIVAGPVVRAILECVGVRNVSSKVIGNRNPFSVTYATFDALGQIKSPAVVAYKRGLRAVLVDKK